MNTWDGSWKPCSTSIGNCFCNILSDLKKISCFYDQKVSTYWIKETLFSQNLEFSTLTLYVTIFFQGNTFRNCLDLLSVWNSNVNIFLSTRYDKPGTVPLGYPLPVLILFSNHCWREPPVCGQDQLVYSWCWSAEGHQLLLLVPTVYKHKHSREGLKRLHHMLKKSFLYLMVENHSFT